MSGLQFQSFSNEGYTQNNSDDYVGRIGESASPLPVHSSVDRDGDSVSLSAPKKNFFSFEFYQQYFDVDTDQVTKRLLNSFVPTTNNFISDFVQPMPDLYGPFWVCVTLVFSIGIFGNIAQYIENEGADGKGYASDFRMVTGACSLISSYVLIIPTILYSLMWYRKCEKVYGFMECLCAYGYSLAIFVPVSVLWTVDVAAFRWALIFGSVALSGAVLIRAFYPCFKSDPNKLIGLGVVAAILLLHFGLAFCFKEYFFDRAHPTRKTTSPTAPAQTAEMEIPQGLPSSVAPPAAASNASLPAGKVKRESDEAGLPAKHAPTNETIPATQPPVAVTEAKKEEEKAAEKEQPKEKEPTGAPAPAVATEKKEEVKTDPTTASKPEEKKKEVEKKEDEKKTDAPAVPAPTEAAKKEEVKEGEKKKEEKEEKE